MESEGKIIIKGARVNNLKNIDLEIPRGKLVVITGLSGSGKSSLAFDTLYAEGQRRYVESLSSYARQFLGRMSKPETDSIKGIPPAIAIEQKVNIRNTRSTVGTSTEIYDYIRMLFARIGKTISPVSGKEVHKDSVSDVADAVLEYPEGTRIALLTKIPERDGRSLKEQLEVLIKEGFTRIETDGEIILISEFLKKSAEDRNRPGREILLLVDRLAVSSEHETTARISDSVETAFFEGNGYAVLKIYTETDTVIREFSRKFEADGMEFEEPSDVMFNFNSPGGACPVCGGSGRYTGIDENLVVPNQSLSLFEDAVTCWKGDLAGEWKQEFIRKSEKHRFPIHRPYYKLTEAEKDLLWNGKNSLKGINDFFIMVEANVHKIQYRVIQARYRGKTLCPACSGTRLKPGANYVKVAGRTIPEIVNTPLSELQKIFYFENRGENNPCPYLNDSDYITARRLLTEINSRLKLVTDVGLGYLTLNRQSSTLSGGESQRINLATSIGSSLTGSLYILDEPSIGLHARDTKRMIKVLRQLQEMGNTVIVVEHDEEIIRSADLLIDIGPGAGQKGGKVVYYGSVPKKGDRPAVQAGIAHTIDYLSGAEQIPVPAKRRRWNNYIEIRGARENNLKEINVRFPLNVITAV
ncbi:MAG: excinuclease ABC subunit A, partial [Dysgonamonadaceae bacterium]|nr:excinuclease ABC subunit A [Dysgonamonadaceae bacterium]